MNKQEVIKKIEELKKYSCGALGADWISLGIDKALNVIKQLDEPKKPVVPQFVADFIDSEQHSCSTLSEAIDNMVDERRILDWFYVNSETFAKAWLYGYEVEKEKLYRARHKLTGEYLSQNYTKTGYYHGLDHFHILKLSKKDWEELGVLGDKVYEIEEVEE